MQTAVDLTETQLRALTTLAKAEKLPLETVVQRAIENYRARRSKERMEAAFGAWGPGEDGLTYQERLRSES